MPIAITSWLRAYFALRERTLETRGFTEVITEDEEVVSTPRSAGTDVIAIAAVIDPHVRALPLEFGALTVTNRWRELVRDLEDLALAAPNTEYPENESFWDTLSQVCVYLHSQAAPMPTPFEWDALIFDLGSALRNAGPKTDGPFKHFDVSSFDELYSAQFNYLREQRGADDKEPEPGMVGFKRPIPRSTNADVIALADYWTKQLNSVKKVFGHDGVAQRWKLALADVDALARKGTPSAIYAKNNAFWRQMSELAIQVSVADEAPTKSDMLADSVKDSVVHLPQNLISGAKSVASEVEDIVGSAAHAIGSIASSAGKGLFAGFGTPLLVGAGLVGLFLITRAGHHETNER